MADFDTAIDTFIAGCQKISEEHTAKWFPNVAASTKTTIIKDGGQKFLRVSREEVVRETNQPITKSVHCFVAQEDGANKKLGAWNAGDVFRADGYKGPARGARGNIFAEDNGLGRMGEYGPAYNR